MDQELKNNISSGENWLRILYIVLFALIIYLLNFIFIAVVLIQILFVLISGQRNDKLLGFANSCVQYVSQTLSFMSFNSEEKPFPFSDWPEPNVTVSNDDEASSANDASSASENNGNQDK